MAYDWDKMMGKQNSDTSSTPKTSSNGLQYDWDKMLGKSSQTVGASNVKKPIFALKPEAQTINKPSVLEAGILEAMGSKGITTKLTPSSDNNKPSTIPAKNNKYFMPKPESKPQTQGSLTLNMSKHEINKLPKAEGKAKQPTYLKRLPIDGGISIEPKEIVTNNAKKIGKDLRVFNATGSAINQVIVDKSKGKGKKASQSAMEGFNKVAKGGFTSVTEAFPEGYQKWREQHPYASLPVEILANIPTEPTNFLPGAGLAKGGIKKASEKAVSREAENIVKAAELGTPYTKAELKRDYGIGLKQQPKTNAPSQINLDTQKLLPPGKGELKRQGIGLKQQPNITTSEAINLSDNLRLKPTTIDGNYKLKPKFTGEYKVSSKPRGKPFSEAETVKSLQPVYKAELPVKNPDKAKSVFTQPNLGTLPKSKNNVPILQQLENNRLKNEQISNRIGNNYKPDWIKNMEEQMQKNIIQGKKDVVNLMRQYNNYNGFVDDYLNKLPYSDEMKQALKNNNFMKDVFEKVNPRAGKQPANIMPESAATAEPITNTSVNHKAKIQQEVSELLKTSDNWKDKSGITGPGRLQRETWDRNIVDIAGKEDGEKIRKAIFEPIHTNEAESIRFKNYWRDKIKPLKLNSKESELVQKFGEGKLTQDDLMNSNLVSHESARKITDSVKVFRQFYDDAINKANEALTRNGYSPVGKLNNYFPHFEGDDPVMKALGIKLDLVDLPTDINGLTHQFRPGKNWLGNFLKRTGDQTTFDAVQGFDRYLEGVSKIIHHTDDIQRLRTFSRGLRTKYSPQEITEQVEQIMKSNLPQEIKDTAIDDLLGRDNTHLSNAVADLDEFTNVLAGKKDLADRASERIFGRQIYNIATFIENRIGKNMVAINPGSWLTNYIPITQSLATTDKASVLKAMNDTMKNIIKNDGVINKSTFLTSRVGSDVLSKGIVEKTGDVLTSPFKWIDNFTSQVVTRSKYYEGIKKGLNPEEAMKQADNWAAKVIGDRSLGAQPTIFNQRNPVTRLFTQFQLEVNNQLSFLFKDLPREYLKDGATTKNIAKLSSAIGQVMVYGWIYNNIYEKLTGRRPALDPIGIAFDFKKDVNNKNLNKSDALLNLGENSFKQLPFVGGLIGGGRIPVSAALPDAGRIAVDTAKALSGEAPKSDALNTIGGELGKSAMYAIPPFGGGQIKKIADTANTFNKPIPGAYRNSKDGEKLQYPINPSLGNKIKGYVFGKSTLPETKSYYDNKRTPLGVKQTDAFKEAVNKGMNPQNVYDQVLSWRQLKPTGNNKGVTKTQKVKDVYSNSKFTPQQAQKLIRLFLNSSE